MTAINANMDAKQKWIPLADPDALAPGFYTLESENIEVGGLHPTSPALAGLGFVPNGRYAKRGIAGSTKASHTSGATLTRYYPDAPGGGLSDPPVQEADASEFAVKTTDANGGIVLDTVDDPDTATQEGQISIEPSSIQANVWKDLVGSVGVRLYSADGRVYLFSADNNGDNYASVEIKPTGIFLNLPTANPEVVGALWNDSGTVKVSAGPPP